MWGIKNQFGKPLEERKVSKTVYENTLETEIETTDDSSESENLEEAEMGDDVLNDDKESEENHSDTVLQQENVVVSKSAEEHEESIADQNVEVENIVKDEKVLSADVSDQQTVGEDVVPDTLYDTMRAIQQTETEAAIDRAKRALETKEQQEAAAKKRLQQIKNAEAEARAAEREKIVRVGIETAKLYKDVLEAPVSEGQKLSPEELKKQYHEMLKKATARAENYENVEVRVPKK